LIGQVQRPDLQEANPVVFGQSKKALSVTLVFNGIYSAVPVGITYAELAGPDEKFVDVPVGVTKLALPANSPLAVSGVLELAVSQQTIAAGTDEANYPVLSSAPTDNQIKVLQITESADNVGDKAKYGTLQFQYDTNPAAGTTVLSPIVEVAMVSTDIAAFFESNYAKLI
jgi:hypothetical protein